jgi:hypothetical protein
MKRGKASRIKGSATDVQSDSALHTQLRFAPHLLPEKDGQMINLVNRQAICIAHKMSIPNNTPPR